MKDIIKSSFSFKPIILYLFSIGYAFIGMLGIQCTLNLLATFSPFADGRYPRFIPFCLITGLLSFAICVFLFILNYYTLLKMDQTTFLPIFIEIGLTIFLCPFFITMWDRVIDWLQIIF